MATQDIQRIHQWITTYTASGSRSAVALAPGTNTDKEAIFQQFCEAFNGQVSGNNIRIHRDGEYPSRLPALITGRYNNIAFQLIPTGKWLDIFLNALSIPDPEKQKISNTVEAIANRLHLPVTLKLFVSHQCPHCPLVISKLLPIAQASPMVSLDIIDTALFPEEAQQRHIRAVPTLIMEDQFRWTGPIDAREILDMIIQRDPSKLSPASLRQFLETGHAQEAAKMMVANNAIFPALIDLLTDDKWPVRLAAMVVVEHLTELAPQIADKLITPLWSRFDQCPMAVKGDLAYVLGAINTQNARDKLNDITTQESDSQVKEAALEALTENNEKYPK